MRPYVFLQLANRYEWARSWMRGAAAPEGETGRQLFIAGNTHVAVGEFVNIEIRLLEEGFTTIIRGMVQGHRAEADNSDGGGAGIVVVVPWTERRALRLLDFVGASKAGAPTMRVEPRFPVAVVMDFAPWDDLRANPFTRSVTANLSRTGAFLRTDDAPTVGTVLNIRFRLPKESRAVEMRGWVVWQSDEVPVGAGVRFIFDQAHARAGINAFVGDLQAMVDRARSRAGAALS